jgi:hypothetical protein
MLRGKRQGDQEIPSPLNNTEIDFIARILCWTLTVRDLVEECLYQEADSMDKE